MDVDGWLNKQRNIVDNIYCIPFQQLVIVLNHLQTTTICSLARHLVCNVWNVSKKPSLGAKISKVGLGRAMPMKLDALLKYGPKTTQ